MSDKSDKTEKKIGKQKTIAGPIRTIAIVICALLVILASIAPLTRLIDRFRLKSKAEDMASSYAQQQRFDNHFPVTVYPEKSGTHLVVHPHTANFSIMLDRGYVGRGLKVIVEVDGYIDRHYVIDFDKPGKTELRARPGDPYNKVVYQPPQSLKFWLTSDCDLPYGILWVVKHSSPNWR